MQKYHWNKNNEYEIKFCVYYRARRAHENTRPLLDEYERRTGTRQKYSHLEYLYDNLKDSFYQDLQEYRTQKLGL
jgi:hypothetical protein